MSRVTTALSIPPLPTTAQQQNISITAGVVLAMQLLLDLAATTPASTSGGLSTGATAGIAVGGALAVLAIGVLCFLLIRKTLQHRRDQGALNDALMRQAENPAPAHPSELHGGPPPAYTSELCGEGFRAELPRSPH